MGLLVDVEQRTRTVYINGTRYGVMVGPDNVANDLEAVDVARRTPARGATGGATLVAPLQGPLRFVCQYRARLVLIAVDTTVRVEALG